MYLYGCYKSRDTNFMCFQLLWTIKDDDAEAMEDGEEASEPETTITAVKSEKAKAQKRKASNDDDDSEEGDVIGDNGTVFYSFLQP